MNRLAAFSIILVISLLGCSQHYYRRQGNLLNFYLNHAEAKVVLFACSADGYETHRAARVNDTTWKISVPAAGEFTYFYIVDGKVFQPPCPLSEKNDYGSFNCLFVPDM